MGVWYARVCLPRCDGRGPNWLRLPAAELGAARGYVLCKRGLARVGRSMRSVCLLRGATAAVSGGAKRTSCDGGVGVGVPTGGVLVAAPDGSGAASLRGRPRPRLGGVGCSAVDWTNSNEGAVRVPATGSATP